MNSKFFTAAAAVALLWPLHAWGQPDHSKSHKPPAASKSAKSAPKPAKGASDRVDVAVK